MNWNAIESIKDQATTFIANRGGELDDSSLLASLAPSAVARQGWLAEYFVAADEIREDGQKMPTAGHRAITEIVNRGSIEVIHDEFRQADGTSTRHSRSCLPGNLSPGRSGSRDTSCSRSSAGDQLHRDWTDRGQAGQVFKPPRRLVIRSFTAKCHSPRSEATVPRSRSASQVPAGS